MEGSHPNPYIQEELSYPLDEDLLHNSPWQGAQGQYLYQEPHAPSHDQFAQYSGAQPTYEHYDMPHQPSYTPMPYSNSPYTTPYQSTAPQDIYSSVPYHMESNTPSLHIPVTNTPLPQDSYYYTPSGSGNNTIAPQSLQYNIPSSQSTNIPISQSPYQRTTGAETTQSPYSYQLGHQQTPTEYFVDPRNSVHSSNGSFGYSLTQSPNHSSVSQSGLTDSLNSNASNIAHGEPRQYSGSSPNFNDNLAAYASPKLAQAPPRETKPIASSVSTSYAPATEQNGSPALKKAVSNDAVAEPPRVDTRKSITTGLRITHPELLTTTNASSGPRLSYASFLAFSDEPIIYNDLKSAIPKYHPRRSSSGKPLVQGLDISKIFGAPARITSKKARAPKPKKAAVSLVKDVVANNKQVITKVPNIREESNGIVGTTKVVSPVSEESSTEESSSEEESEYEDDEMVLTDISEVRGKTRPIDAPAAARWDAIGIVWKDPASNPSADIIKGAIDEYGTFVTTQRSKIKANSQQTEAASGKLAEVDKLKNERSILLESLYQMINAANELGYPAIIENLGGHQKLVNALTTTLIDCIKAEDFLGKLPKAVFNLLSKFQTMSDELLKKLKFDSIQKRWTKKGDDETKKWISSILSNTVEAKQKAQKVKKEVTQDENKKKIAPASEGPKTRPTEAPKPTPSATSIKRPHDGEGTNGKPNKKFAADVAGTPAVAPKAAPVKRPTNVLANLLGTGSKPHAKPPPPPPPPPVKKREPSPPTESRLGAILASIDKPPEPKKTADTPARPPETPEEKKRRERKESRRHLRVRFKEGTELEDVRLFMHEIAEDEGRQDNMLRDAHDDRLEGMMHKQRVLVDMAGLDDDEGSGDFEDRPYPDLIRIDFSELDKTPLFGKGLVTRGGDLTFTTPEQEVQAHREALELMIVYTDPNDMPTTAKEPPQTELNGRTTERLLKEPTAPWLLQRLKELHQYGWQQAIKFSLQRLHERNGKSAQSTSSANIPTLLQQLGGTNQSRQIQHAVAMSPEENAAWESITRIVNELKGKPYPPVEPPAWMSESGKAHWLEGYKRDNANAGIKATDNMQAVPVQSQPPYPALQMHQPMSAAPMQAYLPQDQTSIQPAAYPDVTQQVQSILAGLQTGQNAQNEAPYQPFDISNSGTNGSSMGYGSHGHNHQPAWDGGWNKDGSHSASNEDRNSNKQHSKKQWSTRNEDLFDENGEYKGKKKPCKFWREGKCAKGAKCTFLHD